MNEDGGTIAIPLQAAPLSPRVLALSGGGFLGLYSATVLKQLEYRAAAPLGRQFRLLAGTSIGGVLALALAFELPMSHLVRLFVDHGEEVFSARALPHGWPRCAMPMPSGWRSSCPCRWGAGRWQHERATARGARRAAGRRGRRRRRRQTRA